MHLGLIMDGNGRWATQRSLPRNKGHEEGILAVKRVILASIDLNIDYLTLYAFSTENWKRPENEVSFLMNAFEDRFSEGLQFFLDNDVKVRHRGDITKLPLNVQKALKLAIEKTKDCKSITVVFAINYGGQDEIVRAVNKLTKKNKEITISSIRESLDNPDIPDPDMIVRSSGEKRLSNFMLWDSAYAELLFIDKLWPDWDKQEIAYCLEELSKRHRRFGGLDK